jgi:hypothetical protein
MIDRINELINTSINAFKSEVQSQSKLKLITDTLPVMKSISRLLCMCLESSKPPEPQSYQYLIEYMKRNNIAFASNLTDVEIGTLVSNPTVFKKISFTNEYIGYFEENPPHNFKIENVWKTDNMKLPIYTLIENNDYLYVKYIVSAVITFVINDVDITFIIDFLKNSTEVTPTSNIISVFANCEKQIVTAPIKRYLLDITDPRFNAICVILLSDNINKQIILDAYKMDGEDKVNHDEFDNANGGAIDISSIVPRSPIKQNRPKVKNNKKSYKSVKHLRTRKVNVRQ